MLFGALAFLAELAALGILAAWGWHSAPAGGIRWLLALGLPLAFAVVWGRWLAPRARVRPAPALRLGLKALLFGLVTAAAGQVGGGWVPWVFGLAAGLSLLADLNQPRPA